MCNTSPNVRGVIIVRQYSLPVMRSLRMDLTIRPNRRELEFGLLSHRVQMKRQLKGDGRLCASSKTSIKPVRLTHLGPEPHLQDIGHWLDRKKPDL